VPNFSGTTSATTFETRKVIDLAFGRCKLAPQQITAEYLDIAVDLLYAYLSTLASKGLALWATQKLILPIYQNTQSVPAPAGVVDILDCNLRNMTWLQGSYSASTGVAANAFDQNLDTACVQTAAGGFIQAFFATPVIPTTFGIMPNATDTWNVSIQTSADGITWATVWINPAFEAVTGEWQWFDVQGIPLTGVSYVRLLAGQNTTLNVTEFQIQNNPQEIPIAKINRDDYANLPNKFFPGRPTIFWYDKQIDNPVLTLWPTPQFSYTFAQIVCYVQQYIEDVGLLSQQLWIPQRWFLPIITQLAFELASTIPEVDWSDPRIQLLPTESKAKIDEAWASETDQSPTYWRPNIAAYTR
jgi:hypothetical protein